MRIILDHPVTRILASLSAVVLSLLIGWFSLVPVTDVPGPQFSDKLKHFLAYFALAGALATALGVRRIPLALALPVIFGVGLEVAQALGPAGREGSVLDALANTGGTLTGVTIFYILRRI